MDIPQDLAQLLAGFPSDEDRDAVLASMEIVHVKKLAIPYPPRGEWVAESPEIKDLWQATLTHRSLADKRVDRKDVIHMLDPDRLQHTAWSDQNIIYIDIDTQELVGFVFRKFTGNPSVLGWLDNRVIAATEEIRSARRDDPGLGAQIGYTAGPRSHPDFRWSVSSKVHPPGWRSEYDRQNSAACAYIWNKAKSVMPQPIINDIEATMRVSGLPRMDKLSDDDWKTEDGCYRFPEQSEYERIHPQSGFYHVPFGEHQVRFYGDLAPPAALVGSNYARFTHNEKNAHDWGIQLTTHRSVPPTPVEGGHFYIASYGIRIMADTDSAGAWKANHFHGTTLQRKVPVWGRDVGPYQQRGFAFVTGTGLATAWKKGMEAMAALA